MKIVLSRKGFDSSYGGCPSPILPDESLLSLPIPEMRFSKDLHSKEEIVNWKTFDNKQYLPITYKELTLPTKVGDFFEKNDLPHRTYQDILNDLLPYRILREGKRTFSENLTWSCHLDPDFIHSIKKRPSDWIGIFGQGGSAESHLRNQNIGANDLFLFFGWFKQTLIQNNKIIFDPKDRSGIHLIYGYMQVDYKISYNKNRSKVQSWMNYHPHLRLDAWNNKNNAIYVGRKVLSWDKSLPGTAAFKHDPRIVLTDLTDENNPRRNRTHWRAELFPEEIVMTYHSKNSHKSELDKNSNLRTYYKAADRGQEFVISNPSIIDNWIKEIFDKVKIVT